MKKKSFYLIAIFLLGSFSVFAQGQKSQHDAVRPEKNDVMLSVNFGVSSFLGTSAPAPNSSSYSNSAPTGGWFEKTPNLTVEGRWFMSEKWAWKLTGGFAFSTSPEYSEVTGIAGEIPTYKSVPAANNLQFSLGLGADYYLPARWNKLLLRVGPECVFGYGREIKNAVDSEDYMGSSIGGAYAFSLAPVFGADYFVSPNLFLGFDVRAVEYTYSIYSVRPQAGLGLLSSDNHSFAALARPTIKLGIRF